MLKRLRLGIAAVALALGGASSAWAVPTLKLTSGATTVIVTDGGVGDSDATVGAITYVGAVGPNWFLNTTAGRTKPASGTATAPSMDLGTTSRSLSAGTLTIEFSDDSYGPANGTYTANIGGTIGGSAGSTFSYSTLFSNSNTKFAGTLLTTLGPYTRPPIVPVFSFSGTTSQPLNAPAGVAFTQKLVIVHTSGGASGANADLRFVAASGAIGNFVWNDLNANGIQDPGEPGINGVGVRLIDSTNTVIATATTAGGGLYQFTGLAAGAYQVAVDTNSLPLSGMVASPTLSAGGALPDQDSNPNPAMVTLADGQSDQSIDFGFHGTGTIGNFVWMDTNENGLQETNEPGIDGVTVELKDTAGNILQTTTTNGGGLYLFTGVSAGEYLVNVVLSSAPLAGLIPTFPMTGGDQAVDSNSNPSHVVLPSNSSNDLSVDFGFIPTPAGSIGDLVWKDTNNNGIQDGTPNEPGIPNVTVNLYKGDTAIGMPYLTTTTNADGLYLFSGLEMGTYTVVVVESTLPAGYTSTTANAAGSNTANDSNGSPTVVVLPLNISSDTTVDFGYVPPSHSSIGDFVWNDLDGDGIQDAFEPGIPSVSIKLIDSNGSTFRSTTTDSSGHYQFTGLPAGTYQVVVDPATLPADFIATLSGQGGDRSVDSNGSPATVILPEDTSDLTIDFGFRGTGAIGDFVWMDTDEDGIQDFDELGIAGVTVRLKDAAGHVLQTTVTNNAGYYLFSGLSAGNYFVQVDTSSAPLVGLMATFPLEGSDRGVDSNDNPAAVTLSTNSFHDLSVDFGFIPTPAGSIGDLVWKDTNGNGIQDGTGNEPGIPDVTVRLYSGATVNPMSLLGTASTNAAGLYLFTGLPAGTYTVVVDGTSIPSGYVATTPNVGTDRTVDSNSNPATVVLPRNTSSDTSIDFGYVPPATGTIGNFVWNDLNANGIQDLGEPGIDGVKVTLKGANGTDLQTTITSGGGKYLFTGLSAGNYSVLVDDVSLLASGYSRTTTTAPGSNVNNDSNPNPSSVDLATNTSSNLSIDFGYTTPCESGLIGGINLDGLINNNLLFLFANGSQDANWQAASKGFVGDVIVDGVLANERTSGKFAYAGTIFTNASSLGAWQQIVNNNNGQAMASTGNTALLSTAKSRLLTAFAQINALSASPGFAGVSSTSLNGLNTQNGIAERVVINVTSGFQVSSKINITGDPGDIFILRWDSDANSSNGYQGEVKFQSGGAICPLGGLKASNFIHVAGDINASGGGSNPTAPYPQGPRLNGGAGPLIAGGANFSGGGFFTGYWLTTGDPASGDTHSLSNAVFVGGWYTLSDKFSLTSGTSGVFVAPNCP